MRDDPPVFSEVPSPEAHFIGSNAANVLSDSHGNLHRAMVADALLTGVSDMISTPVKFKGVGSNKLSLLRMS